MTKRFAGNQQGFWRFVRREKGQRNVKDRLFRFLFEEDREALLQLYNALNGTSYEDASELEIVTIESAVYVVMKNDLAFVFAGTLNMYEHQSTYSPNLPVRFLIYLAQEYQAIIEKARVSLYGTGLIKLPAPKCVVFYNGQRGGPFIYDKRFRLPGFLQYFNSAANPFFPALPTECPLIFFHIKFFQYRTKNLRPFSSQNILQYPVFDAIIHCLGKRLFFIDTPHCKLPQHIHKRGVFP